MNRNRQQHLLLYYDHRVCCYLLRAVLWNDCTCTDRNNNVHLWLWPSFCLHFFLLPVWSLWNRQREEVEGNKINWSVLVPNGWWLINHRVFIETISKCVAVRARMKHWSLTAQVKIPEIMRKRWINRWVMDHKVLNAILFD